MILGKNFIFLASLFFFEEAINVMFDDVLERQGSFLIFQDVLDRKQSICHKILTDIVSNYFCVNSNKQTVTTVEP